MNCPGSQNDITVSGDLVYLSTDSSRSRRQLREHDAAGRRTRPRGRASRSSTCPTRRSPKYIKSVETKCGSHTHTLVPGDDADYLYVSSYGPSRDVGRLQAAARPDLHRQGAARRPDERPASSRRPVLFPEGGNTGATGQTSGCHDITAYPSKNIAAGACMGDGVIMDISDPEAPEVIETVRDTNFAFWHSATFNNNAHQGRLHRRARWRRRGDLQRARSGPNRGANAIYDLSARQPADLQVVLQDPPPPERHRELRRPQRVDHPGRRAATSWCSPGTRAASPSGSSPTPATRRSSTTSSAARRWSRRSLRWHVVGVLLQRLRLQLGHPARASTSSMLKDPSLTQGRTRSELDQLNAQSQPVYPIR